MRSNYFYLIVALLFLAVVPLSSKATVNQYTDDFTTTQYKDGLQTTAWWDTVAGELKLHPFEITLVGSYDTPENAVQVAVHGDYAFLTQYANQALIVLDISDPSNPLPVTSLNLPNQAQGPIVISGNYAYVGLIMSSGLSVVDISDPTNPSIVGGYAPLGRCRDIAVDGDYAYIAAGFAGMVVLDISNPANPSLLATSGLGYAHTISCSGDYVYVVTEWNGWNIYDVSDPANPTIIGTYMPPSGYGSKFAVSGDICYLAGGYNGLANDLMVLDISDPTNPSLIGVLETPGIIGYSPTVSGDYLYIGEKLGANVDLLVVDISDPTAPVLLDRYESDFLINCFTMFGEYLFICTREDGLKVVKIAQPVLPPALVGSLYFSSRSLTVKVWGDYAFLGKYIGGQGIQVIDISDPTNPVHVGGCSTPRGVPTVQIAGDYGYTGQCEYGLYVYDFSNPASPVHVATCNTPNSARNCAIEGNYAYVADCPGFVVIDISNPLSPFMAASCNAELAHTIAVSGNYAFCGGFTNGLHVIDIANPLNPMLIGTYPTGICGDLVVDGDYVYVATGDEGLLIYDISDPTSLSLVASYNPGVGIVQPVIEGDYVFLACWSLGLQVLDVTDPANPILIGALDTPSVAHGVDIAGDHVFMAINDHGFYVAQVFQRKYDTQANTAQSLALDDSDDQILKARLTSDQVESVGWELSADGGVNWVEVQPDNSWYTFASPGSDLIWRSTHTLVNPSTNPTCTSLSVEWESLPPVGLDIHPRSCPNPFNIQWLENIDNGKGNDNSKMKKGGVMPAAIVGSESFDVMDINVSTIRLEGVAPLRSSYEDVASPVISSEACACTTAGADGFTDLSLKFSKQEIAAAIGPVEAGDVVELTLTASLLDETRVKASDCIVIVGSREDMPSFASGDEVVLKPAVPNPFNPVTRIGYYLPREEFVKLSVYDVTGKKVDALVEQVQPAGDHFVEWNAGHNASGVYFYRIEVGNFTDTRKLILLK